MQCKRTYFGFWHWHNRPTKRYNIIQCNAEEHIFVSETATRDQQKRYNTIQCNTKKAYLGLWICFNRPTERYNTIPCKRSFILPSQTATIQHETKVLCKGSFISASETAQSKTI